MRLSIRQSVRIAGLFAVLLLFLMPWASRAADETSIKTGLDLYGGYIHNMAVDNYDPANTTVYATANIALGLFYSDDQGENWTQAADDSNIGTVGDIAVADDVSGTAFIVSSTDLMRTEDGGKTWVDLYDSDFGGASLAYMNGILMAATNDNLVYVSDDRGDSIIVKDFHEDATGHVKAVTADETEGLFYAIVTENSGEGDDVIYKTEDSGDTWTQISAAGDWHTIEADPYTPGCVLVLGESGLFYTDDFGATWANIGNTDIEDAASTTFQITYQGPNRFFVGGHFTEDEGATWYDLYSMSHNDDPAGISANGMAYDNENNNLWVSGWSGPCRSDDGGSNFTLMNIGFTGVTVTRIALDASEETVWLATHNGMAKAEDFHSSVLAEEDVEWEFPVLVDENVRTPNILEVSPDDADTVVAFQQSTIYKTEDGGTNWDEYKLPVFAPGMGAVDDLAVDNDGVLYVVYNTEVDDGVAADEYGGVYKSEDFGETWTDLELNQSLTTIVINSDGDLVVSASTQDAYAGGMWIYNEESWTELDELDEMNLDECSINDSLYLPDTGEYVVVTVCDARGGIWVSSDMAEWTDLAEISDEVGGDYEGISVSQDSGVSNGFYVGSGHPGRVGEIYKCTTEECFLYHTGYMEQYFHHMVFDGLLVGATNGAFSFQSILDVTLKKKQKAKKKNKYTLTARAKDSLTSKKLNGRYVKFYRKVGKSKKGTYKFYKKKKVKKGKAVITVKKKKKINWYQARLKPKRDIDQDTYGTTVVKSSKVKIPKRKKTS